MLLQTRSCKYQISNSQFSSNRATNKGGAISYDLFPPIVDASTTTYLGNSALYGNNIGSYPFKLRPFNTTYQFVSGQALPEPYVVVMEDSEGQEIVTDSASTMTLSAVANNVSVVGNLKLTAQ